MNEGSTEGGHGSKHAAIVRNCKRLIADAKLLLEHSRPGSFLSLAILAFEEAGKGYIELTDVKKTRATPSWHQFRQVIASFFLLRSILGKYDIEPIELPEHVQKELRRRGEGSRFLSDAFRDPIPNDLRNAVVEASKPILQHLSGDQAAIAELELRFVRLVAEAAARGEFEEARQRGMYVDIESEIVTSDPSTIKMHEVYRWIFIAERALLLLEKGDIKAPYSPLAARLERRVGHLPISDNRVISFYRDLAKDVSSGTEFIDAYLATLPEDEKREMEIMFPTLKAAWKEINS